MLPKKNDNILKLQNKMWEVVNSVRCSVDGWDFKQYVFAILFYKYLSDHISFYFNHNEHEAGNIDFNYL